MRTKDGTKREVDRSDQTVAEYRRRYQQLARRLGLNGPSEIVAAAKWLSRQDERYSYNTIKQYRASIRQALEDALECEQLCCNDAQTVDAFLRRTPKIKPQKAPRETSALKCKILKQRHVDKLLAIYQQTYASNKNCIMLFVVNATLGMRPIELSSCRVRDGILWIRNAKNTNGRSHGPERRIVLSDHIGMITYIIEWAQAEISQVGSGKFWSRQSARLARICKEARLRRLCFYTTRHAALASVKTIMPSEAVAAFAGHATDRTATTHYTRRRSGMPLRFKVAPNPEDVARVKITGRAYSRPRARLAEAHSLAPR